MDFGGNLGPFRKRWFGPVASDSVPWGIVCGRMELLASGKLGMEKTGKECVCVCGGGGPNISFQNILPVAWLTSIGSYLLRVPSFSTAAPAKDQANFRGILTIQISAFNTSCFSTYPNTDPLDSVFKLLLYLKLENKEKADTS